MTAKPKLRMSAVIHGGKEYLLTPDIEKLIDMIGREQNIPTPQLTVIFGEYENAKNAFTEQLERVCASHHIEWSKLMELIPQYETAKQNEGQANDQG